MFISPYNILQFKIMNFLMFIFTRNKLCLSALIIFFSFMIMKSYDCSFYFSFLFFNSVGLHTDLELQAMVQRMESAQLQTINLTENDLVKDHLRHLVCISFICFLCFGNDSQKYVSTLS